MKDNGKLVASFIYLNSAVNMQDMSESELNKQIKVKVEFSKSSLNSYDKLKIDIVQHSGHAESCCKKALTI